MEIQTQTTQGSANSSARAGAEPAPASGSALSSDFETFLKMLTTQMENQDPLNPIESADFAVQLATFSGVEQQVRTNDLLAEMIAGNGVSGLGQLAGWVGMEARIGAQAEFSGAPITLAPEPDPASDAAFLIVRDTNGTQVSREGLPLNAETVLWGGVGSDGTPLENGSYTFEIESVNSGEVTSTKPVEHYALIREARLGSDGVEIVFAGGATVPSTDVRALRSPQAQL